MEELKAELQGKKKSKSLDDCLEHDAFTADFSELSASCVDDDDERYEEGVSDEEDEDQVLNDILHGDDRYSYRSLLNVCDNNVQLMRSQLIDLHLLPSIEENSEPSTSGSSKSDLNNRRVISSSMHNLSSTGPTDDTHREYSNTFPRPRMLSLDSHMSLPKQTFAHTSVLYPLEPRELDPESFCQLHTADSQEELQEFLLLESQCMTNDAGLAAAFQHDNQKDQK